MMPIAIGVRRAELAFLHKLRVPPESLPRNRGKAPSRVRIFGGPRIQIVYKGAGQPNLLPQDAISRHGQHGAIVLHLTVEQADGAPTTLKGKRAHHSQSLRKAHARGDGEAGRKKRLNSYLHS